MELMANGESIEGEGPGGVIELFKIGNEMLGVVGPTGQGYQVEAKPLVFRTKVGKATVSFIKALTEGAQIEAQIRFFRPGPGGEIEHYFTIEVNNARLTRYRSASSTSSTDPPIFEFEMTYQNIAWTYESTGDQHEWNFRP
jgi:type VI secretion system Hcp family effector